MTWAVAVVLAAWTALRWTGLLLGVVRMRRLDGPVRREARRAAIGRTALNVVVSVATLYAFALALELQPTEAFVGLLGGLIMIALVVWAAAGFMQPAERDPRTIELFRLLRTGD